jgi:hypothetical protein
MTDQLMVLGELASYMENPLDRSIPNYPMVGGPWHHMFTSTDTVSRCIPRFRRTSVALSRHQGASAQDVLLKDSNRAQAALGTRRQHFHPERTCAGSIQGLAKLPRRHSHLPAEIHR